MGTKSIDWRPGPTVCRCCLAEGCYKDISTEYFWMGKREVYSEMLTETFDINIAYSTSGPNSNSRLICEPCISRLRDACEFKRQVHECEKTFMQYLDPGASSTMLDTQVTVEVMDSEVKLEQVKQEKAHSDDDDDDDFAGPNYPDDDEDDDDLDDQPLTKFATRIPKKESVDILDLLDNAKAAEKRKSTTKSKAPPPKKTKVNLKDIQIKPTASKAKSSSTQGKVLKITPAKPPIQVKPVAKVVKKKKGNNTPISENPPTADNVVPLFQVAYDRTLCKPLGTIVDFEKLELARLLKYSCGPTTSNYGNHTPSRSPSPLETKPELLPKKHLMLPKNKTKQADFRQNPLAVFEFSTVYPFVYGNNKFKCFICSQPFLETSLLRQHMTDGHTFAPLKRLLNNRRENVLKVDVTDMVCKICSHKPKSFMDLKKHLKQEHDKVIDINLRDNMIPFKLEVEDGQYKCVICEQNFIKVRLLVIHMSVHFNNYSCEICGSGFMTLRLLKKHLEVHENGNFPCDRCEKVFTTPHKRSLHVRGVHLKQYPRRCPFCPERFNSNYRRTIHLQDVHNQSTRVHKCETCGRAFNLKYHLKCHMKSVHLQERNQQCDVCHQRFCSKETLKRHMVIHTGEKNYKCEICGMAFLRRKNLKDHLRLHDIV